VLSPMTTDQLIPSVNIFLPIPVVAGIKALERAQEQKIFFEVPCKIRIAFGRFIAAVVCATEPSLELRIHRRTGLSGIT
jgi:hypothetical protein